MDRTFKAGFIESGKCLVLKCELMTSDSKSKKDFEFKNLQKDFCMQLNSKPWNIPFDLNFTEVTTSTMDFARNHLKNPKIYIDSNDIMHFSTMLRTVQHEQSQSYSIYFAKDQLQGRGRQGKSWVSSAGEGLYFTIAHSVDSQIKQLSCLSLVIGIALCRVLRRYSAEVFLKWPNDVIVISGGRRRKLAGVLVELGAGSHLSSNTLLVGIGVNLNINSFPEEIPGISLSNLTLRLPSAGALLAEICIEYVEILQNFLESGFSAFRTEWMDLAVPYGSEQVLRVREERIVGEYSGINEDGALIFKESISGLTRVVYAGDLEV